MAETEDIFAAFESAIGRPTPACIRTFYTDFNQSHCPGEFYDIPLDRFDNMDKLLVQYFNPITDVSDLQIRTEAYYFCFAASQDEWDWWLKIERDGGDVKLCSTFVGSGNRLTDLQCYGLSFEELLSCPYRSTQ